MNIKIAKARPKMQFRVLLICILMTIILLAIAVGPAAAMRNPAAVYCEALGYNFVVESTAEGERGLCQLSNNERVSAWEFFEGKVAQEYSYCHIMGYEIKTVTDSEQCPVFSAGDCAFCVLGDGTEVEVSALMGLTFGDEPVCGDGWYITPEDSETCPQDCLPSAPNPGGGLGAGAWTGIGIAILLTVGLGIWLIVRRRQQAEVQQ